jgi:hypothetical protein
MTISDQTLSTVAASLGIKQHYLNFLKTLFNKLKLEEDLFPEIDIWLYPNYDKLRIAIDEYNNNQTKRNYIIAIAKTMMKLKTYKEDNEIGITAKALITEYKKLSEKKIKTGSSSGTKIKSFLTYEKLCQKRDLVAAQYKRYGNAKLSTMHLLLSLVTLQPPLRLSHYLNLEIIKTQEQLNTIIENIKTENSSSTGNLLFCDTVNRRVSYYLFSDKTASNSNPIIMEYNQELSTIILDSIDTYPRKYLFSGKHSSEKSMSKQMVQLLIFDTFNRENLRMSMKLMRNAYIIEFYKQKENSVERSNIAKLMRHTEETAMSIYNKYRNVKLPDIQVFEVKVTPKGKPIACSNINKPKYNYDNDKDNESGTDCCSENSNVESNGLPDSDYLTAIHQNRNSVIKNAYEVYTIKLYLDNTMKQVFSSRSFLDIVANVIFHHTHEYNLFAYYVSKNLTNDATITEYLWKQVSQLTVYSLDVLRTEVSKFNNNYSKILIFDYLYWNECLNKLFAHCKNVTTTNGTNNTEFHTNISVALANLFYSSNYEKYTCNSNHLINFNETFRENLLDFVQYELATYNNCVSDNGNDSEVSLLVKDYLVKNTDIVNNIESIIKKYLTIKPETCITILASLNVSKQTVILDKINLEEISKSLLLTLGDDYDSEKINNKGSDGEIRLNTRGSTVNMVLTGDCVDKITAVSRSNGNSNCSGGGASGSGSGSVSSISNNSNIIDEPKIKDGKIRLVKKPLTKFKAGNSAAGYISSSSSSSAY